MSKKMITRFASACFGLVLLGSLVACGDSGDEGGVATLSNGESASADDDSDGGGGGSGGRGSSQEFEDAMLEFTECMRENGVDMPDPTFDGEGSGPVIARRVESDGDGGDVTGAVNGVPFDVADGADFEKANEACQPLLDEAMKDAPKPSAEEMAEMQDRMLEFAACMREHGVDLPDPTFEGEGGGMRVEMGGGAGGGGAVRPDDEKFQEANEACAEEGGPGMVFGPASRAGGSTASDGDDE